MAADVKGNCRLWNEEECAASEGSKRVCSRRAGLAVLFADLAVPRADTNTFAAHFVLSQLE
jgi:hypothetical protein